MGFVWCINFNIWITKKILSFFSIRGDPYQKKVNFFFLTIMKIYKPFESACQIQPICVGLKKFTYFSNFGTWVKLVRGSNFRNKYNFNIFSISKFPKKLYLITFISTIKALFHYSLDNEEDYGIVTNTHFSYVFYVQVMPKKVRSKKKNCSFLQSKKLLG